MTWDWHSEPIDAGPDIARRLRLQESTPLTKTRYVFRADGRPLQLATSYEPLEFAPIRTRNGGAWSPGCTRTA